VAAEQFGTNLRATVATTTPNLVRGGLIPMTLAVQAGVVYFPLGGVVLVVGAATILAALAGLWLLEETYGRDLDFVEA
ncbi:MAG TPA: hypothetical protein VI565_07560, partial [Burkholderiales bacterium]|nr:hypothetical protein [Burkholderiales bacterium]